VILPGKFWAPIGRTGEIDDAQASQSPRRDICQIVTEKGNAMPFCGVFNDVTAFPRLPFAPSGCVCTAILALAGCSPSASGSHVANTAPTTPAASTLAQGTAPSSPAVSSTPAPSTGAPNSAPGIGRLTVTITGLPADPVLVFDGQPATFTVTLRNGSGSTYRDITPLVSIGHCSCSTSPAALAPLGTLAELDSSTGNWHPVAYVTEGTGMDYLLGNVVQQPPFTLAPDATASFTFRLAFAALADQQPSVERTGQTSIDVTVLTVPSRKVIRGTYLSVTAAKPAS
jgi:hypothetical protein